MRGTGAISATAVVGGAVTSTGAGGATVVTVTVVAVESSAEVAAELNCSAAVSKSMRELRS